MNGLVARGYTLVLPPGWTRIPLRAGTADAIAAIVRRGSATSGEYSHRLRAATAAAENNGGLDLYLPTEPAYGIVPAASFVVGEVSFGALDPLDPALLVAAMSSADGALPIGVDGVVGVRKESVEPADEARDVQFASHHVEYVVPVPGDPDRWLSVAFSTLETANADPDLQDLLVELFDAIMTTFRWAR